MSNIKSVIISKDAHSKLELIRSHLGARSYKDALEELIIRKHKKILSKIELKKPYRKIKTGISAEYEQMMRDNSA